MARKLPDLSTTQLIASAAATTVAAFGASYLGVYGTIIGAALMSVISTAGSAVGKHYLDQGRDQLKDLAHLQGASRRRQAARDAAQEATSSDPARTVTRTSVAPPGMAGDPNATRLDPPLAGDPDPTRFRSGGDPNATRVDDPAATVAESLAEESGADPVREAARRSAWRGTVEWAKAHWVALAVSSAGVFAIVLGGITLIEATTGQPIGGGGKSGLTVTKVLGGDTGGQRGDTPEREPSDGPDEQRGPGGEPTGEAPGTGSGAPEPQPTDGESEQPTGQPTQQPTQEPTQQQPPTAPTTAPEPPEPPQGPQGGGPADAPGAEQQTPAE